MFDTVNVRIRPGSHVAGFQAGTGWRRIGSIAAERDGQHHVEREDEEDQQVDRGGRPRSSARTTEAPTRPAHGRRAVPRPAARAGSAWCCC